MNQRPFSERWNMVKNEVIEPRNNEKMMNHYYRYELEPFSVRRKGFWPLDDVGKILKDFIPNLTHESDGLIFQGWDDAYVPLTHEGLLKWKYAEMNSVDFLFEIEEDGRQKLFLYERGKKKLMDGYAVEFRNDDSDPATCSGKIVECSWDKDKKVWVSIYMDQSRQTNTK